MPKFRDVLAIALLLILVPTTSAFAHILRAFAYAEGAVIQGAVYFAGNAPARGALIRLLDPHGAVVAEATSNDAGRFVLPANRGTAYRILADAGDGHQAEYRFRPEELPDSAGQPAMSETLTPDNAFPTAAAGGSSAVSETTLEAIVERSVARHVGLLREQLAAYEDAVRWRDVLGGLGYILGITGLACWLIERRRRG